MTWPKKVESIISCGMALHDTGVNNWALTKQQALSVLDKFEAEKIYVLGGDVYELVDGELESNYDNWYCDRETDELLENYITRSINKARSYIANYNRPKQNFFVFVTD